MGNNFRPLLAAGLVICMMIVAGTGCGAVNDTVPGEPDRLIDLSPLETGLTVVRLMKNVDMESLAIYVHPDKGVRLTPYAYVNAVPDRIMTAEELSDAMNDTTIYNWGTYDGSGEPIELTFAEYFNQFIYSADFADAQIIGNNTVVGSGNSLNNISEAYPDAIFVEFHFKGFNSQYEGMDWESLRLVFEDVDGIWYLTGIIHDQWTI